MRPGNNVTDDFLWILVNGHGNQIQMTLSWGAGESPASLGPEREREKVAGGEKATEAALPQ